jgi:hypothetical protein
MTIAKVFSMVPLNPYSDPTKPLYSFISRLSDAGEALVIVVPFFILLKNSFVLEKKCIFLLP